MDRYSIMCGVTQFNSGHVTAQNCVIFVLYDKQQDFDHSL